MDVKALRDAVQYTAEDFGAIVYVDAATVYAWETGRRNCTPLAWEFLQVYFGKKAQRTAPGVRPKAGPALPPDIKAQLRTLAQVRALVEKL